VSTEIERLKLVGVLAASYPNTQISDATIKAYAHFLKDVPLPLLQAAIAQCADECTFFPVVAEIKKRVRAIAEPARDTSADAWLEVTRQIKVHGFYGQPKFDDVVTARVVEAMDWQTLCSSENVVADRIHFMKMYDAMNTRETEDAKNEPIRKLLRGDSNAALPEHSGN
jgi:hypothetical protein